MINHSVVEGRLGKDPEIREAKSSGKNFVMFSLACDRNYKNKQTGKPDTDWVPVICWDDRRHDFILNNLDKGDKVVVTGRMENNKRPDGTDFWYLNLNEVSPQHKPRDR